MKESLKGQSMLGEIIDNAINDFKSGASKTDNPFPDDSPESLLWDITFEISTTEKEITKTLNGNPLFERNSQAEKDFIKQKLNQIQQDFTM